MMENFKGATLTTSKERKLDELSQPSLKIHHLVLAFPTIESVLLNDFLRIRTPPA